MGFLPGCCLLSSPSSCFTSPHPPGCPSDYPLCCSPQQCIGQLQILRQRDPWQRGNSLTDAIARSHHSPEVREPRPFPDLASSSPGPSADLICKMEAGSSAPIAARGKGKGKGKRQEQRASYFLLSKFHFHSHSVSEDLVHWLHPTET